MFRLEVHLGGHPLFELQDGHLWLQKNTISIFRIITLEGSDQEKENLAFMSYTNCSLDGLKCKVRIESHLKNSV